MPYFQVPVPFSNIVFKIVCRLNLFVIKTARTLAVLFHRAKIIRGCFWQVICCTHFECHIYHHHPPETALGSDATPARRPDLGRAHTCTRIIVSDVRGP